MTGYGVLGIASGGAIGEGGDVQDALASAFAVLPVYGFAVGLLWPISDRVDAVIRWVVTALLTGGAAALACAAGAAAADVLGAGNSAVGWWGAGAAVVVAVLVVPPARRIADLVVYRGRPDPVTVLSDLGRQVAHAEAGVGSVPDAVVELTRSSLHLRGVELRGPTSFTARSGEVGASAATFPVVYQGEELALLAAEPRPGESSLTVHDRRVLTQVAQQAGPPLHGARAMVDLVDARARLVLAREDERRRLRRDLHDDLAPTLAGLGHVAAAIERLAGTGDTAIGPVAADLQDGIRSATRQVREIAYDLRPPVLDDKGLVAALRERVVWSPDTVPLVELQVPTERLALPAAVESAALRIVQECVANVRRHAAAARCVVSLQVVAETLRIEVTDDGRGLPSPVRAGVGLRSVVERSTELGGTSTFERLPGHGTRVTACLPIFLDTDWQSR